MLQQGPSHYLPDQEHSQESRQSGATALLDAERSGTVALQNWAQLKSILGNIEKGANTHSSPQQRQIQVNLFEQALALLPVADVGVARKRLMVIYGDLSNARDYLSYLQKLDQFDQCSHDCQTLWHELSGRFSLDIKHRYVSAGAPPDTEVVLRKAAALPDKERQQVYGALIASFRSAERQDELLQKQGRLLSDLIADHCRIISAALISLQHVRAAESALSTRSLNLIAEASQLEAMLHLTIDCRHRLVSALRTIQMEGTSIAQIQTRINELALELSTIEEKLSASVEDQTPEVTERSEGYVEIGGAIDPSEKSNTWSCCSSTKEKVPDILELQQALINLQTKAAALPLQDLLDEINLLQVRLDSINFQYHAQTIELAYDCLQQGKDVLNAKLPLLPEQRVALRLLLLRSIEILYLPVWFKRVCGEVLLARGKVETATRYLFEGYSAAITLNQPLGYDCPSPLEIMREAEKGISTQLSRTYGLDTGMSGLLSRYRESLLLYLDAGRNIASLLVITLMGAGISACDRVVSFQQLHHDRRVDRASELVQHAALHLNSRAHEHALSNLVDYLSGRCQLENATKAMIMSMAATSFTLAPDTVSDLLATFHHPNLESTFAFGFLEADANRLAEQLTGEPGETALADVYRQLTYEEIIGSDCYFGFLQRIRVQTNSIDESTVSSILLALSLPPDRLLKLFETTPSLPIPSYLRRLAKRPSQALTGEEAQTLAAKMCQGRSPAGKAQLAIKLLTGTRRNLLGHWQAKERLIPSVGRHHRQTIPLYMPASAGYPASTIKLLCLAPPSLASEPPPGLDLPLLPLSTRQSYRMRLCPHPVTEPILKWTGRISTLQPAEFMLTSC